jgi:acetylornithine deacetylase/succinyl-diaminopimelate desuccinylase-like protein
MYQLLRSRTDGLREACVAFARDLVRLPSPSFQESAVAQRTEQEMDRVGFDRVVRDDFGNVVGILHGREPEPTLLLTCHMDTVDPGEAHAWAKDPYAGHVEDGRLYGVGAGDCKGGLAGIVYAAAALKRSLLPLRGNLVVAATVAEERGGSVGVRGLLEQTLPDLELYPTHAVLAEPTGLGLYYGHDGWLEVEIVVEGRRRSSVNDAAWTIFEDVSELEKQTRRPGGPETLAALPPSWEGTAGLPRATIRMDRRMKATEGVDDVLGHVRHHAVLATRSMSAVAVNVAVREQEERLYTGRTTMLRRVTNAWATDPFHPLMEQARRSLAAGGCTTRCGTWKLGRLGMGTAGGVLLDTFGVPTVGYGPGDEATVHTANEWVAVDSIREAVYGTAVLAQGLIGVPVLAWTAGEI